MELAVWHRIKQAIKSDLIAGFLVVIPLATTIWLTFTIARSVIGWLTRIPKQLNPFTAWNPIILESVNLFVGLAVPLFGILLIGLMARNIVGRWLLEAGEGILTKIPLAGTVYRVLQQLLETLLRDSRNRFRRVVLVEYPRPGLWAVGFVTGSIAGALADTFPSPMVSIFIPTSPNPTTGWYAIAPEQELIGLDISIEDAFKLIISGGIVTPNWTAINPRPEVALTNLPS
ncbi:DUF502 domain-containing protein [Synechococcus sp. PCC 6312]|uniref:DUF502 domain-containing protein n=1 Tax=Synechococcus sp. (strain ATCC 27167 / PCC 6312) TaxID=195253 RepID=UPI00029F1065|nr:DUF502 domain-containing protein [Synechococcus sp. PCC 6312]AFY59325.1 hypothetical protein Syn6312_0071 [Synechococcus sp. PCC 6312]